MPSLFPKSLSVQSNKSLAGMKDSMHIQCSPIHKDFPVAFSAADSSLMGANASFTSQQIRKYIICAIIGASNWQLAD